MIPLHFDFYDFERGISRDGITVFSKNIPLISNWMEIRIMFGVGARHDPPGKEGLAHFFEHMPFKGSSRFPDYSEIKKIKDRLFQGTLNATTSTDQTCFKGRAFKEDLPQAMHFFADFIFHPLLRTEDIEKERKVIIREIWNGLDSKKTAELIKRKNLSLFNSANHPVGRMPNAAGWEDSVLNILPADLEVQKSSYNKQNCVLVFVGDVSLAEGLSYADIFSKAAPLGTPDKKDPVSHPVLQSWPRPLEREINVTIQELGFSSLEYGMVEMTRILASAIPANLIRIFNGIISQDLSLKIREELGANYSIKFKLNCYKDLYLWNICIKTAPNLVDDVGKIIMNSLAEISAGKKEDLFDSAKQKALVSKVMTCPDPNRIADNSIDDIVLFGKVISLQEELDRLGLITHADVLELVKKEFRPELLMQFKLYPTIA